MIMNTIMNLNMCDCAAGTALVLGSYVPYKKQNPDSARTEIIAGIWSRNGSPSGDFE